MLPWYIVIDCTCEVDADVIVALLKGKNNVIISDLPLTDNVVFLKTLLMENLLRLIFRRKTKCYKGRYYTINIHLNPIIASMK